MTRGRILIVEDEPDLAWVEQFNLEGEGYDVQVAHEGQEAIAALDSFLPHVMVLDLMLPHVSGWAVLAAVNKLPPERRPLVIVVSAVAGASDQMKTTDHTVGSFLPKPFDMDDLVRVVGESIGSAGRR